METNDQELCFEWISIGIIRQLVTGRQRSLPPTTPWAVTFFEGLAQSDHISLHEIRRELLTPDAIVLEYWLNDPESYLWILSHQDLQVFTLPSGSEIRSTATRLYNDLTVRARAVPAVNPAKHRATVAETEQRLIELSRRLSEILLAPAAKHLESKRILIAGSDILSYLPFAALPDPVDAERKPLGVTHEIINIPSAMAVTALRRMRRTVSSPKKLLALLADPSYEGTNGSSSGSSLLTQVGQRFRLRDAAMARLPYARREAETILELVPGRDATLFQGAQASREAVLRGDLSGHRIIHFATHGFVDTDEPSNSGMLLSSLTPDGRSCDGMLRLRDVRRLRLSADLVVLSACETALGRKFRAEATLGLTGAFLFGGRLTSRFHSLENRRRGYGRVHESLLRTSVARQTFAD